MRQRDLVINAVLFVLIGATGYFAITFKPAKLSNPDWLARSAATSSQTGKETRFGAAVPARPPQQLAFVRWNPMRTIIPTPTPRPRTPTPTPPPPPLGLLMQQFQLVMPDPPNSVMLLDKKTKEMTTWKVGETRTLTHPKGTLRVTLVRVDPNDFSVHFTAPGNEPYVFRFFK